MAAPSGRHRLGPGSGHLLVHIRREGLAAKIGRGTTTVTQAAYGIPPYSAFFGALRIRDAVEVGFEVAVGRAV